VDIVPTDVKPAPPPPLLLHGDLNIKNTFIWAHNDVGTAGAATATTTDTITEPAHVSPDIVVSPTFASSLTSNTVAGPTVASHPLLVLDWADAGWGDPLYDLIALHMSVFRFDTSLLRTFWTAYKAQLLPEAQHFASGCGGSQGVGGCQLLAQRLAACGSSEDGIRALWPHRWSTAAQGNSGGTLSVNGIQSRAHKSDRPHWGAAQLSHVAMAYTLLHEEASNLPDGVWSTWAAAAGSGGGGGVGAAAAATTACAGEIGAEATVTANAMSVVAQFVWGPLDE
jgi:hypothetical protein